MRILGLEITRHRKKAYPVESSGSWYPYAPFGTEHYSGAWQRNDEWSTESVLSFHAVYSCLTLISSDIGKLRWGVVRRDSDGIWIPASRPAINKILKNPNSYQNYIQFKEWWAASKLIWGNTYALKVRGPTGEIEELMILDPSRVKPMVTDSGMVLYQLSSNKLNKITEHSVTVPASEIIHDRMNCLYHPLVGVSPLYAAGLAAASGLEIENDSKSFFTNGANPGGILTAPGAIGDKTAARLKAYWQDNFTGDNSGKVAALGDGLKFEAMRMSSVDAQLLEQLKWSAEIVCSAYKVPPYKIGIGAAPSSSNVEALTQDYYSNCLQISIEQMETACDDGFELPDNERIQMDLDGLFRMDQKTMEETLAIGVKGGFRSPDEARKRLNLGPVAGGSMPYLQQQNYSLEALANRDATNPLVEEPAPPPPPEEDDEEENTERALAALKSKQLDFA